MSSESDGELARHRTQLLAQVQSIDDFAGQIAAHGTVLLGVSSESQLCSMIDQYHARDVRLISTEVISLCPISHLLRDCGSIYIHHGPAMSHAGRELPHQMCHPR